MRRLLQAIEHTHAHTICPNAAATDSQKGTQRAVHLCTQNPNENTHSLYTFMYTPTHIQANIGALWHMGESLSRTPFHFQWHTHTHTRTHAHTRAHIGQTTHAHSHTISHTNDGRHDGTYTDTKSETRILHAYAQRERQSSEHTHALATQYNTTSYIKRWGGVVLYSTLTPYKDGTTSLVYSWVCMYVYYIYVAAGEP